MSDPIESVEVATAALPLPVPLRLGSLVVHRREYAAVRVRTRDGLVGKAYCLTREAPVAACVSRLMLPLLADRDSIAVADRWQECFRGTAAVGRTGLVVRALGLVDVALWDIAAQRAGLPLWRLLGGTGAAPTIDVMMIAAYPADGRGVEALAADVVRHGVAGHRLLKIARSPDRGLMRALLAGAADGLPNGCRIVVDAAFGWHSADKALDEVAAWGDVELAWLEDPLLPEDANGCAAIRQRGPHAIGVGDDVTDPHTLARLIDADALDVLRLDVMAIGGVTPALRVLDLADGAGVPISFHIYPEVSVHLAAARAPGAPVEMFEPGVPGGNRLDPSDRLGRRELALTGGSVQAPAGAGLAFDLHWDMFTREEGAR